MRERHYQQRINGKSVLAAAVQLYTPEPQPPSLRQRLEACATIAQRAAVLLEEGVFAKIDIDDETMTPVYRAFVADDISLPVTAETEQECIQAGTAWLKTKAEGSE